MLRPGHPPALRPPVVLLAGVLCVVACEPSREGVNRALAPGDTVVIDGTAPSCASCAALRNTIVEVIDTRRAVLLARLQLPFGAVQFAPGYVARPTSDAAGHLRMQIHRVELSRQ